MLKFILIVSKQGQTRLAQYYDERREPAQRTLLEAELIRKVLVRGNKGVRLAHVGWWTQYLVLKW